MPDPLTRVKRAAKIRRIADQEYRSAIVAAADTGLSYAVLARELDLTRQTIRVLVERERARQSLTGGA